MLVLMVRKCTQEALRLRTALAQPLVAAIFNPKFTRQATTGCQECKSAYDYSIEINGKEPAARKYTQKHETCRPGQEPMRRKRQLSEKPKGKRRRRAEYIETPFSGLSNLESLLYKSCATANTRLNFTPPSMPVDQHVCHVPSGNVCGL